MNKINIHTISIEIDYLNIKNIYEGTSDIWDTMVLSDIDDMVETVLICVKSTNYK